MAGAGLKVIYIMGAGHIGSTVLDVAMSSHPKLESLGEVSKFHGFGWRLAENRRCACGATVYDCPFWTRVRHRWSELTGSEDAARYMELQPHHERTAAGWRRLLWNRFTRTSAFLEYQRGTEAVYQAVQEIGGSEYLVDSSLTPKRAYAQALNPNIDLYLIHLVRDGRGVMWSLMKPNKKIPGRPYVPAPPERTTKYWVSANLQSAWVMRQVDEDKRLRIRYEDFALDPSGTLERIGGLIGEDMSGLVQDGRLTTPSTARHTVGGNRVRFIKDEELRIRADFSWLDNLADEHRRLFWRRAGWLARRFGYLRDQRQYGSRPSGDTALQGSG